MKTNIKKIILNIIPILVMILLVIVSIVVSYQVIKAIIGGTWETENIIIAGMGMFLAGLFVIVGFLMHQAKILGILSERTKNIGEDLIKLGNDFKEHTKEKHKS